MHSTLRRDPGEVGLGSFAMTTRPVAEDGARKQAAKPAEDCAREDDPDERSVGGANDPTQFHLPRVRADEGDQRCECPNKSNRNRVKCRAASVATGARQTRLNPFELGSYFGSAHRASIPLGGKRLRRSSGYQHSDATLARAVKCSPSFAGGCASQQEPELRKRSRMTPGVIQFAVWRSLRRSRGLYDGNRSRRMTLPLVPKPRLHASRCFRTA